MDDFLKYKLTYKHVARWESLVTTVSALFKFARNWPTRNKLSFDNSKTNCKTEINEVSVPLSPKNRRKKTKNTSRNYSLFFVLKWFVITDL